ncbi:MAG: hypothetical protein OEV62_09180, partial [Actinomycetota bacterium]|nr:hypothetical protein [Actinomycetota bacterium]
MAPAERYGPTGMRPPTHRIAPQPSRLSRHSGAVVLTVAALVVGSSGVAAAVTGDPFAPIKGMTHLVTGGADAGEGHVVAGPGGRKKGSLPETAAHVAVFTKKLTGVRPMLAKGDADAARDVLQSALADLVASGAPIPPGLQNRIDKLADRIDAVAATGDQGSGSGSDQGSGSGSDQGSGSGSDQGSGSGSGSGSDQGSGGGSDQGSGSGSDQGSGGGSDQGSGSGSDQGSGGGSGSGSGSGSDQR